MPPKDSKTEYEFLSVVIRSVRDGNYVLTVYGVSEDGMKVVHMGGFNKNVEPLLQALKRYGYRVTGGTGDAAARILATGGNYDGLVLTVQSVN